MELVIIAAVDNNNGIGYKGGLLCHLPADLRHFKQLTVGHSVIMGRKTFESLPSGPLPNRRNIVVSSSLSAGEGYEVASSLEQALELCAGEECVYVIGGAMLYNAAMKYANRMELTKINAVFEADTFFPPIDYSQWSIKNSEEHAADEKNHYDFAFYSYAKKVPCLL